MVLQVDDLRFSYGKQEVLKGVSFSLERGESLCVLGQNGVGKTTLFRCILGMLSGYTGGLFTNGVSNKQLSAKNLSRQVAYIPQNHDPIFNFTVFEVVLMGTNVLLDQLQTPGKAEEALALEALALLGISSLKERGYAQLSGGERQLVLIARALAQQSNLLIMDEPTANLDFGNQFRMMEQVQTLTKQHYSVIFSSHNPSHALLHADKVLVLEQGVVTHFGHPKDCLSSQVLEEIYGISIELAQVQTKRGLIPVAIPYEKE